MMNAVIIGAGPAGLTAAYELLAHGAGNWNVTVLEETDYFGGISRTVCHNGNRMDMGGHRFFSKVERVNVWWQHMMPMQGYPSLDDILLHREVMLSAGGPDPEKTDGVMLSRHRVSRIFFNGKFFDYPITLKPATFRNMGIVTTFLAGVSYILAKMRPLPETNLENFYINRFGRKLYSMFFEHYTENLWGRHPSKIDASWGKQRVKGLSISAIVKDVLCKAFVKKGRRVETSLIEEFKYPKLGPGQLWDITAAMIRKMGGVVVTGRRVIRINKNNDNKITSLVCVHDGVEQVIVGDVFISSMPLKDLIEGMNDVPLNVRHIAQGLPYRDYMTVGVLIPKLLLQNKTKLKTVANIVPDCWIYVHGKRVKMGRFQIYNNWSPYMVKDIEHTVWVGLEYFVDEGDKWWSMNDGEFTMAAISEMITIGLIASSDCVLDTHVERVRKAYPAYFDTYNEIGTLVKYLNTIDNLYCVGRNGQHRYNNIDHSMCTSFEAVSNILTGRSDKSNVWSVNTEEEYHETKEEATNNG